MNFQHLQHMDADDVQAAMKDGTVELMKGALSILPP
jgi:hypothetical protein